MATGTVTVRAGATLIAWVAALITSSTGLGAIISTGAVTPTYDGSDPWYLDLNSISVGSPEGGRLDITDTSYVHTSAMSIGGYGAGSKGTVRVLGGYLYAENGISIGGMDRGIFRVKDGGHVTTGFGQSTLGWSAGETGEALVTGAASQWDTGVFLIVGEHGHGSLVIADGGSVHNHEDTWVGRATGSGTITFDQGSLATGGLFASPAELLGVGTINTTGWVTDTDLVFDATTGPTIQVILDEQPGQDVTVNVDVTATPGLSQGSLGAGYRGTGTLTVTGGVQVGSARGVLGERAGSHGSATVSGPGSAWEVYSAGTANIPQIVVGSEGDGVLQIDDGGLVKADILYIAFHPGSNGAVRVTGPGSLLEINSLQIGWGGAGSLTVENGGHVESSYEVSVRDGGLVEGDGTITAQEVKNQGTVRPGNSIGTLAVTGDYHHMEGGTLEIEFGGAGNPVDLLQITGDAVIAALGTTLELRALGPMAAGTYTVMESIGGTIVGMFENISPFNLFGVNVTVLNTGTAITVTLDGDLIFADLNMDGFVGIADLNIVLDNWNQSVTPGDVLAGDLNGDGFVGIEDLNAVLGHWNTGTPPPPEVLASVPEPAGVVLMLAGVAGLSRGWCRGAA